MNFCKVNEYELTSGLQRASPGSGGFRLNVQTRRLLSLAKKKKTQTHFIVHKTTAKVVFTEALYQTTVLSWYQLKSKTVFGCFHT